MSVDLSKICRICLSEGARNIYEKLNSGVKISSLENLLEKMRYVTMIQVSKEILRRNGYFYDCV